MNKIIIGGGDEEELPDALDVAELVPLNQGTPPVDPRMRSRRIGVKRDEGKKRLRLVIAAAIVVVLVVGTLAVLSSPWFSIDAVRVTGALYTGPEVLDPILDPVVGEPTLTVDTDAIESRLESLPWVRRAAVRTDFPRTLLVELDERRPAAVYQGTDGRWRVVDRSGRVIAVEDGQPIDYLAIAVAGGGPDREPGQDAGATFNAFGELAETIADLPELAGVVSGMSLSSGDAFGLVLRIEGREDEIPVNLGQASDLRTKLAVLITLSRAGEFADAVAIDVSDPSRPAIQN